MFSLIYPFKKENIKNNILFVGPVFSDMKDVIGPYISTYYMMQVLKKKNRNILHFSMLSNKLESIKNALICDSIWFTYPRGRKNGLCILLISTIFKKKLVVYIKDLPVIQFRDLMLQEKSFFDAWTFRFVEYWLFSKADVLISTSPFYYEQININSHNLKIVFPPGVCDEDFSQEYKVEKENEYPILLYAGSLDRAGMITKISTMFNEIDDWKFWIAGKGSEKIDLNDNVVYYGQLPKVELRELYSQADAIIIPYPLLEYYDMIIPLKTAELLATGKPIITLNLKGIEAYSRFLGISSNFIFVEDWSKKELLRALNQVPDTSKAISPDLKEKMSAFTWEKRVRKLIDYVDNCEHDTNSLIWI